jgi:hypothetical protein
MHIDRFTIKKFFRALIEQIKRDFKMRDEKGSPVREEQADKRSLIYY